MLIRLFDVLFSTLAIIFFTPFMIPIMIGLKLTGEHFIFYLQPRIGIGGKEFKIIKFATMLKDSPNLSGGFITQRDDPRILPMGKFLRKTKINELPQLVNIVLGQMSFVGPRPVVARHLELYSPEAQAVILSQRPGLTGIASLVFRDEEGVLDRMPGDRKFNHDTIIAPYKGMLEQWYVNQRTPGVYFLLIFLTAWSVIKPASTAYAQVFKHLPEAPAELKGLI
jgi:lipopolysaccharide/colanic/teichoic acid biosynthesis glycosyltransferase